MSHGKLHITVTEWMEKSWEWHVPCPRLWKRNIQPGECNFSMPNKTLFLLISCDSANLSAVRLSTFPGSTNMCINTFSACPSSRPGDLHPNLLFYNKESLIISLGLLKWTENWLQVVCSDSQNQFWCVNDTGKEYSRILETTTFSPPRRTDVTVLCQSCHF